jgi:FolB domain-containing protein
MNLDQYDKILITDLLVRCRIGVPEEERINPQDIQVNLELYCAEHPLWINDDINETVDYSAVVKRVLELAELNSRHTIEAFAEDIARLCLSFSRVYGVKVRVEKPHCLRFAQSAGVEIKRVKSA